MRTGCTHLFAVMSLSQATTAKVPNVPTGVRCDGTRGKFRPFHSRLRQCLYNKGIKYKMALLQQGEFKGMSYKPDQIITKIPKLGSDGLPTLQEKYETEQAQRCDYQLLYNTIAEQIHHAVQRSVTDRACDVIVSHSITEGDGITLHQKLIETFQGKGNVSLLSLCGRLFRLSMTGKLEDLDSYTAQFNELTAMLKNQRQTLGAQLVSAMYLVGLSSKCQYIKDAVADDETGLDDVNKIIERVRAHKVLKECQQGISPAPSANVVDRKSSDPPGEKKCRCFNCKRVHVGGEKKCKAPCRMCKQKGHTRYSCPQRNRQKKFGNIADQRTIETSLINWGNVAYIGRPQSKPKLDSGAHWHLFASDDNSRFQNVQQHQGYVKVGNGATLSELHKADVGNLKDVKVVQGLS